MVFSILPVLHQKDIVKFFEPLKIKIIRSILNANGRRKGKLYVEFFSEEDVTQALTKHKQYLGNIIVMWMVMTAKRSYFLHCTLNTDCFSFFFFGGGMCDLNFHSTLQAFGRL